MDHGASSRLALSAPSDPESKSPRVERAKTDPPHGAFTVGHYQPPEASQMFCLKSKDLTVPNLSVATKTNSSSNRNNSKTN